MKKYKILTTIIMIIGLIMISRASETKNLTKAVSNLTFAPKQEATVKEQHTICIDPGHQAKGNSQTEQVGPNSGSYKAKVSSGTAGIATKKPEYELNLEASLKLKHILESRGYKVYMTRESHDVDISNKERAIFANEKKVDMVVRIHADGSEDQSVSGASLHIPAQNGQYTSKIYPKSNECAEIMMASMRQAGFKVNNIYQRSDLTGFNWSEVPAVLVEMGYMSNPEEDQKMSQTSYQEKMMKSIAEATQKYFNQN